MRAYLSRVAECGRDVHLFLGFALLSYLGIGVFALIFNLYLVRLGYNEAFIGAFNAVYTLTMGIACLGLGFLINRFGNWACLTWGTVAFIVTSITICFITNAILLLICAVMIGVGSAFIMTAQMPFAIEWTPPRHTAAIAALSSAINSASVMLGSLIGGLLPGLLASDADSVFAYRWTLVIGAALTALSLPPMLAMGEARRERHHADFRVAHAQLLTVDVRKRARRDISALVLLGLFLALGVGAIEPFYNVLLEDMGTPASSIGLIFALSGLVATAVSIGGPALANRIGLAAAQIWIRLFHVPIHLALIVFPNAAIVSAAYASRKLSGSMAWPLESAHVGGLLPPQARAHAFGLRSASWNIGYAFAAFISGIVIARTGSYTPAYVALGIFCTLSVLVYVVAYGSRIPASYGPQAAPDPDAGERTLASTSPASE
jgi:MFS family permease